MTHSISIADLRRERGETLEQFAAVLGLGSKGGMSRIERGLLGVSLDIALKLEDLSGGRIDAAALNADVARARARAGVAGSNMAAADTAAETIAPACNRAPLTTPPLTVPEDGLSLTTRRVA